MAVKKSEKRQRDAQIKIRCTADEFNAISAKAAKSGFTVPAFLRAAATGSAGPRAQRQLPVDALVLRQALAQMGKIGSNMNQIAYQLNTHGARGLTADFRQALAEWSEVRDLMLEALGQSPESQKPVASVSRFMPKK